MRCTNCGDEILDSATRYEEVTPVEGGGQTMEEYCSVGCLNEDAGFTEEEIEEIVRQSQYEIPTGDGAEWGVDINSYIDDLVTDGTGGGGEFFLLFFHEERNYDVEVFHDHTEQIYEVVLYTYDVTDEGEKVGLEDVRKEYTGEVQRALGYAEDMMQSVEGGEA